MAEMTPEQATQNAANHLMMLQMNVKNMMVVHLSASRSVNLSNVCSYEAREKAKLDKKGQPVIDAETGGEIGTGEFFTVLVCQGGGEIELTEDEDKEFREAWERYASLAGQAHALMSSLFPEPVEIQETAEAAPAA